MVARVRVGPYFGTTSAKVGSALASFDRKLAEAVAQLDRLIPDGVDLNADELAAIIDVCAWAHAEWVRIHPFVNGNGRTARLLVNGLAMRYGLPPFVPLRPRPGEQYAQASNAAMEGEWQPTAGLFREMLKSALEGTGGKATQL